jgi:hypothetical protein
LPLFKAFVEGSYADAAGKVNNLSLDINGIDLNNPDIYTNVNGSLKTDIVELSLPIKLSEYGPVKLIFLPVEILSNINEYTKSNVVPPGLSEVFKYANNISKGLTSMHFKQSNIDIALKKGKIQVEKLEMTGGTLSPVQSISIKGYIDLSNQINIKTKTNFIGVIIPLNIDGTIGTPKPNITMLLPGLVLGTAQSLLETGFNITKDIAPGVIKAGKNLGSVLTGSSSK